MNDNKFKKIMSDEIQKRINSREWNYHIASTVQQKKVKTRKWVFYSTSLSSLAVAALVLIVLLFGINNEPQSKIYNKFISKQIIGTHNQVFKKDFKLSSNGTADYDKLMTNEFDDFIDETLAMR